MPANLTALYMKALADYRRASGVEEELRCLQVMFRELPKHKGTEKLQADLKQKISRLKVEAERGPGTNRRIGFRMPRQGAGRVVLIGGPNAGKSQLVRCLTRAEPEVAPYPFTTRTPMPAMMPCEDVTVQLVDTPPITLELFDPNVEALIRGADVVLWVVDVGTDEGVDGAHGLWEKVKKSKTRLAAASYLDSSDVGTSYTQTIVALNKIDCGEHRSRHEMVHDLCEFDFPEYLISAEAGEGIEELRAAAYRALDVVRVYTKQPNDKEPDMEKPFTVPRGDTLLEVAALIHEDLVANFKSARVWGKGFHAGTTVKSDYVVRDQDIVEIHS
jgi:ribosome-interacting GTPase 1